jgi:hypothetical protein
MAGKPRPRKLAVPNGASVKARGRNWENALVSLFVRLGFFGAKRNGAIYGSADRGDIGGLPLTVQAKAVDRILFWKYLDDAIEQAGHNGTGGETCVIYKRHGESTDDSAWVFPGRFAQALITCYYQTSLIQGNLLMTTNEIPLGEQDCA